MATLTVWRFPTPHGADEAEYTLDQLRKQGLIKVHDAALVLWDIGATKPRTRQLNNLTGAGALGGSFWGLLFGICSSLLSLAWPSVPRWGLGQDP